MGHSRSFFRITNRLSEPKFIHTLFIFVLFSLFDKKKCSGMHRTKIDCNHAIKWYCLYKWTLSLQSSCDNQHLICLHFFLSSDRRKILLLQISWLVVIGAIKSSYKIYSFTCQGVLGSLSQFPPFHYFSFYGIEDTRCLINTMFMFDWCCNSLLCGDSCQIWMWLNIPQGTFAKSDIFITEILKNKAFGMYPRMKNSTPTEENVGTDILHDHMRFYLSQNKTFSQIGQIHVWWHFSILVGPENFTCNIMFLILLLRRMKPVCSK